MFVAPASRASAATAPRLSLAAVARAENVTLPLRHGDRVAFSERFLDARATPGRTDGCLTFVLDDQSMAFTGDALWTSITTRILPLSNHCLLYPGEDDTGRGATFVAEEMLFNARLGGTARECDFMGHMEAMKLPHPAPAQAGRPRVANLCGGLSCWTAEGYPLKGVPVI